MPKTIAHKNPSTLKPGTILAVSIIKRAFITKVNKPKVINVIGRVKIRRIGLITAFIIPNTRAVTSAAVKLVT